MRLVTSVLLFTLILLSTVGLAQARNIYPEDGWWWDASAPGRGYLLERQGDVTFITYFHYTDTGAPEWLAMVTQYTAADVIEAIIGTLNGYVRQYFHHHRILLSGFLLRPQSDVLRPGLPG